MPKRLFDIVGAIVGLIVLAPLFLIVVCLVRCQMGSPVFFYQIRPGKDGRPFRMVKFRTMHNTIDTKGKLLEDGQRLTNIGRKLRATSVDEIPELWNVLKGEMSLVGPRPLLTDYLSLYSPHQARRHEVRPGITGWAQVNGRNAISWEEKFALDVWYVENQSLWLDLKILWMTLHKVFRREDISASGEATMPKFHGSSKDGQ